MICDTTFSDFQQNAKITDIGRQRIKISYEIGIDI